MRRISSFERQFPPESFFVMKKYGWEMSSREMRSFLSGKHLVKLATVKKNGRPHLVPLWYDYDGKNLLITTSKTSAKIRYLRDNPYAACIIEQQKLPYKTVIIEGRTEIIDDQDYVERITIQIAKKYLGSERGRRYGRLLVKSGRYVLRIAPEKTLSWNNGLKAYP